MLDLNFNMSLNRIQAAKAVAGEHLRMLSIIFQSPLKSRLRPRKTVGKMPKYLLNLWDIFSVCSALFELKRDRTVRRSIIILGGERTDDSERSQSSHSFWEYGSGKHTAIT